MERRTFLIAGQMFIQLVARVPEDGWDRPALGSWSVRSLVGHTGRALTTVVDYVARPAAREDLDSAAAYLAAVHAAGPGMHAEVAERGVAAGAALGPRPAAAVTQLLEDATMMLLSVAADQDPLVSTAAGGMRLSAYLPTRTVELTVHSLDLAATLGLPLDVPAEVMAITLQVLVAAGVSNGQGPQLVRSLTGREPLPDGFTVL